MSAATLSIDLDDVWTYLKVRGDTAWQERPSHFEVVVPALLDALREAKATATVFVVGADVTLPGRAVWLQQIARAGHEIGNHSLEHVSWQRALPAVDLIADIDASHEALTRLTGCAPIGYRAPGFSWNRTILEALARRGYQYDASVFPTWLGPLARRTYRARTAPNPEHLRQLDGLFGDAADGRLPLRPFYWGLERDLRLLEVPVTTVPIVRTPLHHTYIAYLANFSESLAMTYVNAAVRLCRATGTPISYLLHPTDFVGADAVPALSFFPAMSMPTTRKLRLLHRVLRRLSDAGTLRSIGAALGEMRRPTLPIRTPARSRDR